MSREIIEAVKSIERERGLEEATLLNALEDGLLAAYRKLPGSARLAAVEVDDHSGDFHVYAYEIPNELEERLLDEARERALEELERREEEARSRGERFQATLIRDEDLEIDWTQVPDDQITRRDVTPEGFGRIAAMTARQVIQQRLREAERQIAYEEYKDRVGEMVTGIVRQADARSVLVDLGRTEAVLPRSEQIPGERYEPNTRVRALIIEVRSEGPGSMVVLSRRDPWLVAELFAMEVPEIADGLVEVKAVARDPGVRAKILVQSHAAGVDPVGACVGPRGARVRPVVSELRGEKIDIIPFQDDPARAIARALQPARVSEVFVDEEAKEAVVVVPEDQRALAIGKEGGNVRLASRLMGWRIDVQSAAEFAETDLAREEAREEQAGRCAAILSSGKRCPNAALEGSRYCGIPAHQALEGQEPATLEAEVPVATEAELVAADTEEPGAVVSEAADEEAAPDLAEASADVEEMVKDTDVAEGPVVQEPEQDLVAEGIENSWSEER